jgi:RNA-directed DNA polymerase
MEVKPTVKRFLKVRGLELSEEKTRVTHVDDGFDFLGWNFKRYRDSVHCAFMVKPSKKNIKNFLSNIKEVFDNNKTAKTANLINFLNPRIRGWVNYHKMVVAKQTFSYIDNALYEMQWRWAKRRHPVKGKKWIKDKYVSAPPTPV